MIASGCQRWRDRRGTYRPAGEVIDARRYEVAAIGETEAKAFVCRHHYAASYPAARFRFGLYGLFHSSPLVGVVVFSHPVNVGVFRGLPGAGLERTELGRLVLLDEVPGNGESFFVARAFDLVRREGIVGVVSDADPLRTVGLDGAEVCRGHVGTVYGALNGAYQGQTKWSWRHLLPNGRVFSRRALQKIRARERGWRYAADVLVAFGASPLSADADAHEWLATWLPRLTRKVRHPGNHRYLFGLDGAARRALPEGLPYPKLGVAA